MRNLLFPGQSGALRARLHPSAHLDLALCRRRAFQVVLCSPMINSFKFFACTQSVRGCDKVQEEGAPQPTAERRLHGFASKKFPSPSFLFGAFLFHYRMVGLPVTGVPGTGYCNQYLILHLKFNVATVVLIHPVHVVPVQRSEVKVVR